MLQNFSRNYNATKRKEFSILNKSEKKLILKFITTQMNLYSIFIRDVEHLWLYDVRYSGVLNFSSLS